MEQDDLLQMLEESISDDDLNSLLEQSVDEEPEEEAPLNIGSTMYDGMSIEDANAYYEDLKNNPNVSVQNDSPSISEQGKMYVYTNPKTGERKPVPRPNRTMFGFGDEATVNALQTAGLGVAESVGDAVEFGAALVDKAAGAIGMDPNLTEQVQENTFNYDTSDSLMDSLIADGVPALAAGVGAGAAVLKGATMIPTAVRAVGAALAGEAAATATVGTEEGTLTLGEDATFPLLGGINVAELGDEEADKVIEQRLNTFTEGLALGGLLSGAAIGAKEGLKIAGDFFVGGYMAILKPDTAVERKVYLDLSRELANLPTNATPQQIAEARERVAQIVRENKEVIIRTLNSVQTDKKVNRDTVGALINGLGDAGDIANAQGIRAGAMNTTPGSPIARAVDAPVEAVQKELKGQAEELGGPTRESQNATLQEGAEAIVEQGRTEIDSAIGGARVLTEAYENTVDRIYEGIADDLELGETIEKLKQATGTEIPLDRTATREQIETALTTSYREMKDLKDAKYAAIQGGSVDAEMIVGELSKLSNDAEALIRGSFPANSPLNRIVTMYKDARRVLAEGLEEGEEIDPAEVTRMVEEQLQAMGADFGFFYRQVKPELSMMAQEAFGNNKTALGTYFRGLSRFIDNEMLDHVIKTGDKDVAAAAKEAKDYYQNEFAPIFADGGSMQDFAELYNRTLSRTDSADMTALVEGRGFNQSGFNEGIQDMTKGILEGNNSARITNLAKAIESSGEADKIADYMIMDVLNQFANDIKSQGMQGIDYGKLTTALQRYAENLNAAFPDKAESINTFIARLTAAKSNQQELQRVLDGALERGKGAREEIQNSVIMRFIDGNADQISKVIDVNEIRTTGNPYSSFTKIFTDPQESINRTQDLMSLVDSIANPAERKVIQDSIRLAYSRLVDNNLVGRKVQTTGANPMNNAAGARAEEGVTSLFDVGRVIYKDNPEIIEAMEVALGEARRIDQSKSATPIASQSATGYNRAAQTATNRLIYQIVGPLSRAGTRIRSISSGLIEKIDPETRAEKVLQRILAEPDEYLALAEKYNRNPKDPMLEDLMITYLISGIMKTDLESPDPTGMAEAAVDKTNDVVDETEEALQFIFPE